MRCSLKRRIKVSENKLEKKKRLQQLVSSEIPKAKTLAATAQRALSDLEREAKTLDIELTAKPGDVRVSDHALVRYLERVMKFDIEAVRKQILTPEREHYIRAGASRIIVDGVQFVVRDKTIVTTID